MRAYNLSLSQVKGHYHWPRKGLSVPNKDCPHFLMDRGRPGPTWQWFLGRVQMHYNRMLPGPATPLG